MRLSSRFVVGHRFYTLELGAWRLTVTFWWSRVRPWGFQVHNQCAYSFAVPFLSGTLMHHHNRGRR